MSINTAKTIIAVLAVALIGSLFLNFNLESENRDLNQKIDQLVTITQESQSDKEHLEFQKQRLEREMNDAALKTSSDSLFRDAGSSNNQQTTGQRNYEQMQNYPQGQAPPTQQTPQATYPQTNSTPSFEDMNRKHQ